MYKRFLTALTVALAGLAIGVPVATARLSLQTSGSQEVQKTWTWPSKRATTTPVTSSSNGFDWNDAGAGVGFALGALLVGTGIVVTMRRRHGPLAH